MDEKKGFSYRYNTNEQDEINAIRNKYVKKEEEEDKLELLKKLDRKVTEKGTIWSLAIGIIGTLILGTGMSCFMVWNLCVLGVVIGIIGIGGVASAYPMFQYITKKQRELYGPQILKLTEELMK